MTPVSPKGPERGARPYSVVELRDRIAQEISDADGGASSVDPDGDATYEQMADAALAVVAPEVERLTFERDAAQAAADLLVQQLEDLRDDVLGDESLLVPEIVSAAGRTVERLTAETTQLRADLRIRQGALNDVLGRERSADYYSAVEDVAELKRENGRLTAEVERLRDATDRVVELEHDADRVRDALLPILRGHRYTQHEVQGDWLRSGYVAERAANLLRRDAAVENSLRGERDRAVSLAHDLTEERDEWKQSATAEADLLAAQPPTDLVERAAVWLFRAKTSRLKQEDAAYAQRTWNDVLDVRDTDAWKRYAEAMLIDLGWGVSSSEAPQPQEMTQHKVTVQLDDSETLWHAVCDVCGPSEPSSYHAVRSMADQHEADTLRPQVGGPIPAGRSFLTDEPGPPGFLVPNGVEGRPSGSEAALPRPVETFDCKQDCPAVAPECFCVGLDAHRICCHTVAAQAARSEATPRVWTSGEPEPIEPGLTIRSYDDVTWFRRPSGQWTGSAGWAFGSWSLLLDAEGTLTEVLDSPSPSLRKEGEDR